MAIEKNINSRIIHKHDIEANWNRATTFIPKQGEIIIYDADNNYNYSRLKIGDGVNIINDLKFFEIYIDYENDLAFNTNEIVFGGSNSSSILGQAILGQMILA